MRIALAQYSMAPRVDENLLSVQTFIARAAQAKAGLVLFPELCLSPFFPQYPAVDASAFLLKTTDRTMQQIRAACRDHGVWAAPNVYLDEGGRHFDASVLISSDGDLIGLTKMAHIAQLPGFHEQDYYAPSDTGFPVFETALGKVAIVVCFDRHFPESIRTCALRGADLILVPTANVISEPRDLFVCEMRTAAMQNGVYIAMCNRVGREGDAEFCGESLVVDPDGVVLEMASRDETLLVADLDFARIAVARRKRPYLQLRRPELYER
jgi:predicted amidohydrolase